MKPVHDLVPFLRAGCAVAVLAGVLAGMLAGMAIQRYCRRGCTAPSDTDPAA